MEIIKKKSNSHIVYPGIKELERGVIPIASIPGVKEAGWIQELHASANTAKNERPKGSRLQIYLKALHADIHVRLIN